MADKVNDAFDQLLDRTRIDIARIRDLGEKVSELFHPKRGGANLTLMQVTTAQAVAHALEECADTMQSVERIHDVLVLARKDRREDQATLARCADALARLAIRSDERRKTTDTTVRGAISLADILERMKAAASEADEPEQQPETEQPS